MPKKIGCRKTIVTAEAKDINDAHFATVITTEPDVANGGSDVTLVTLSIGNNQIVRSIDGGSLTIQTSDPAEAPITNAGTNVDPNGGQVGNVNADQDRFFELTPVIDETLNNSTGDWTYTYDLMLNLYNNPTPVAYQLVVVKESPFVV